MTQLGTSESPAHVVPADWRDLATRYGRKTQSALAGSILPFWSRTLDARHGGIFNCWNNTNTQLVSRDKFTWSQGRFVWMWSRLAEVVGRGLLPGARAAFLAHAGKTVAFLEAHAFLDDGRCAFLLSESGEVKELTPAAGKAPSIYADCFVVMGFAEYARLSGNRAVLDAAWRLLESIERRLAAGGFPTFPDPIPEDHVSHAIAMIYLNVTLVVCAACAGLGDPRTAEIRARNVAAAARIFDTFMLPGGRLAELRAAPRQSEDTLLCRHINPGHALEGLWMLLSVAVREGRADWLARASQAVRFAFERGWDDVHGGLLHFVDADGGPPVGAEGNSIYERSVRGTWDTKLWWVHSEALYASLLCYRYTGDAAVREWFERTWAYTFRTFPHPDVSIGEWIQIRDRRGAPLDRVVALPVKDPYHITRNLIQIVELCSEDLKSNPP